MPPVIPRSLAVALGPCWLIVALASVWPTLLSAEPTLVARVLDTFQEPGALTIDPLDDNDETMAAVAIVETAIRQRGIAMRDDAPYILQVEVDPAARMPYLDRGADPAAAGSYHAGRRDNPVDELAPSPELAPTGPEANRPNTPGPGPHLAVILTLYKHQQPPEWVARAVAPRDNRPVKQQVESLADLAMRYFARSAAVGFRNESGE
ncbi:MAG: hypothetical protein D6763_08535 [Alphaproteobacteria bacterium]|nr:MAG: hypothetical protein D6763_08535 [Alphaproteobacteria bacterium]